MPISRDLNLYANSRQGNGGFGEGFLNVLAYQDSLAANKAAQQQANALSESQAQQQQFDNAMKMGEYQQNQSKLSQEQAMKMFETVGPIAAQLAAMPEEQRAQAYTPIASQISRMFPDANIPLQYSPDVGQNIAGIAQAWQAKNPKEDKGFDFKNNGIGVIQTLAPKIQDGTATQDERNAYALATQAFTQPRVINDPVSGQQTLMQPTLPSGFPNVSGGNVQQQQGGPTEPPKNPKVTSLGGVRFRPINDISKLTRPELQAYRTSIKTANIMKQELKTLKEDISKNGLRTTDLGVIGDRASKYSNALMLYKEILNLGVLNGPDLEIMERIMFSPSSPKSWALGDEAVINSFNNVISSLDRNLSYMERTAPELFSGEEQGSGNVEQQPTIKFDSQGNMIP